jgi:predicted lipid carrier protein YhbT
VIEGDTEAGLRLKNLLDSVELPRLLAGPHSLPAIVLAALARTAPEAGKAD